ncbi:MAG TPA: hypothetical protein ENH12_00755 [Proteobacteria bacterium]|nr:hypothetical protein [Pseudomonadota bacterium]
MKIFNREFAGTVLIWLGVLIFLGVIYDCISPVFPQNAPYPFISSIQSFFRGESSPAKKGESERMPPPQRSHPPKQLRNIQNDGKMLTTSVYRPGESYRHWVWAVKPEYLSGEEITVEMAHGAAGDEGGFNIIAYADTNGDGKPDKKIAESKFLTGEKAGAWSSFTFSTGEKSLFVGSSWPSDNNTVTFRGNGEWPRENFPLEGRFFYIIDGKNSRSAGPAFTNLIFAAQK